MMELKAQTVKWFKLSDELLDPLTSLGALTASLKARFSLFPPRWFRSCPWIRDVGGAGAGAGDNGLDGFLVRRKEDCSENWKEGWADGC